MRQRRVEREGAKHHTLNPKVFGKKLFFLVISDQETYDQGGPLCPGKRFRTQGLGADQSLCCERSLAVKVGGSCQTLNCKTPRFVAKKLKAKPLPVKSALPEGRVRSWGLEADRNPCGSEGLAVKVRGAQPNRIHSTLRFLAQPSKGNPLPMKSALPRKMVGS